MLIVVYGNESDRKMETSIMVTNIMSIEWFVSDGSLKHGGKNFLSHKKGYTYPRYLLFN